MNNENVIIDAEVITDKQPTPNAGAMDILTSLNAMSAQGMTVTAFQKAADANKNPNQPKLTPEETKFKIQAIRKEIDKIRFSTMSKEDKDIEIAELNAIIAGLK